MITAAEIRASFPAWAPVILADSTYAKPTAAWLRDSFWPWFQRKRWDLGLSKWTRKNDCDGFARAYAQYASDCHALTVGEDSEGLAVGQFHYVGAQGPHAIAVAFTDEGRIHIEPQTGARLNLTPAEEMACFFAYF